VAAELFVDTGVWYAAANPRASEHAACAAALRQSVGAGARLVTTNLVLAECHALLLHRVHRAAALAVLRTLRHPPNRIVPSTPALEERAITDWLEPFADQTFSFTDAVSFAVMADRGIREALTLDRHFAAAGFRRAAVGG
jgi:predicted nucleic acid-binding protein